MNIVTNRTPYNSLTTFTTNEDLKEGLLLHEYKLKGNNTSYYNIEMFHDKERSKYCIIGVTVDQLKELVNHLENKSN